MIHFCDFIEACFCSGNTEDFLGNVPQQTELKVCINCQKCKTEVLKTVAKNTGVDEVKLDAEKGILTVVGRVDPIRVASTLRKAGYFAEITSIGPPKKPDPDPIKIDEPKPSQLSTCCSKCQLVAVSYATYYSPLCSIL